MTWKFNISFSTVISLLQRVSQEPCVHWRIWSTEHCHGSAHIWILKQGRTAEGIVEESQPWAKGKYNYQLPYSWIDFGKIHFGRFHMLLKADLASARVTGISLATSLKMGSWFKQIPLLRFIASCVLASSCSYTMVHSSTSQPWPAAAGPGHSEELTIDCSKVINNDNILLAWFHCQYFDVCLTGMRWYVPAANTTWVVVFFLSFSLSVSARRIEEPSACLCSCTWWPGLTIRSLFLLPL